MFPWKLAEMAVCLNSSIMVLVLVNWLETTVTSNLDSRVIHSFNSGICYKNMVKPRILWKLLL